MHTLDKEINKVLEKIIFPDTKIVVGVSGGPDSMFLLYKLKAFWKEKKYNTNHLYVITCDHQTRQETQQEVKLVREYSQPHRCTIQQYTGTTFTEKDLRDRRHKEFITLCKKHNAKYLFLGHHLNDRIETSILNIMRGCGITGLQAMKEIQPHYLDHKIDIIRPLIYSTKSEIEQACEYYKIPYSIDPSNTKEEVSKRNNIRKKFYSLKEKEKIEKSLSNLYKYLDSVENKEKESLSITGSLLSTKAGERDEEKLYTTYKSHGISINPRENTLPTLSKQLQKPGSKIIYQGITIRAYSYGSVIQTTK